MKKLNEEGMRSELSGSAFFPASRPASQLVTPPASQAAGPPVGESANQPTSQEAGEPAARPARWSAPERDHRQLEEHAYDIFPDQARWLSRIQLELQEGRGDKVNKYEIVQVALDWLRQDFEAKGEASQLAKALARKP